MFIAKLALACISIILINSLFASGVIEKQAKILEPGVLLIKGKFKKDDSSVLDLLNDDIHTIVISSKGGDVDTALNIANKMLDLEVEKIVVDGICYSSCANYIFLAGKKKYLKEDSFLGYHGSILTNKSLFSRVGAAKKIKLKEQAFLDRLEIKVDLYQNSEVLTKRKYDLWMPSKETLESYGVCGIKEFWYPETLQEMRELIDSLRDAEGKERLKIYGDY